MSRLVICALLLLSACADTREAIRAADDPTLHTEPYNGHRWARETFQRSKGGE